MVTISMFEVGIQRAEGFLDGIDRISDLEIVAEQDAAGPEVGADVVETILQANPDLDFIWAANEGGAVGAVVGVTTSGRADEVLVFGTDMSAQAAQYLLDEDSPLYAVSTQQPYEIGYQSMKTAAAVLRGEDAPAEVIVPLDLYSKENIRRVEEYVAEAEEIMN
jgi:ABC-type sugar transport system substrate-binding protein